MIKFIIRNTDTFANLLRIPVLNKFLFFDLTKLDKVSDEKLFNKAITQIRLSNGIYKTTRKNRFSDVDSKVWPILKYRDALNIHDVAVSDGVTSVELFDELRKYSDKISLTISDKYAKIFAKKKSYGYLYFEENGHVLFADFFGVLAFRHTSVLFFVSKILGFFFPTLCMDQSGANEILMINPRTMEKMTQGHIRFTSFDVFQSVNDFKKDFNFVRCMNLLNIGVFSRAMVMDGVKNISSLLCEGGILLIGHTDEMNFINHASFFKKEKDKLVWVVDVNEGSAIKREATEIILTDV